MTEPARSTELCAHRHHRKSPAFVGTTFGLWLATVVVLGRHLWPVMVTGQGFLQRCVLIAFSMLFLAFWLLGSYHIALVIFHFRSKARTTPCPAPSERHRIGVPPVAILYPTCDDFQPDAVLTYLAQDYPDFHVFLLDDSTSREYQHLVDDFGRAHPVTVTVVRRGAREGFKSGNLNHALRGPAKSFPVFAVMDADERIPRTFLRDMVAHLVGSEYAFVQANHAPNPKQSGAFAKTMGQTILPFWSVMLSSKNRYGFVPCVGHGVVIRRSAWEEVGGFPEVASEDLAFSIVLLEKGWRGVYAEEVLCYEDFPTSLTAFKRQQARYVAGVLEAFINYWPRVLLSRRPSIVEKADLVLCCLPLYIPTLCFLYVLICGAGIPLCFGAIGGIAAESRLGGLHIPYFRLSDGCFQSLWNPLFVYPSILLSLSPTLPAVALALSGKIKRFVRLIMVSNLLYMSTMLVAFGSIVRYAVGRQVQFSPTGADVKRRKEIGNRVMLCSTVGEIMFCIAVTGVLLASLNFGLAGIALCPLLSLVPGLKVRRIELAAGMVFLAIAFQVLAGIVSGCSPVALPALGFSVHF